MLRSAKKKMAQPRRRISVGAMKGHPLRIACCPGGVKAKAAAPDAGPAQSLADCSRKAGWRLAWRFLRPGLVGCERSGTQGGEGHDDLKFMGHGVQHAESSEQKGGRHPVAGAPHFECGPVLGLDVRRELGLYVATELRDDGRYGLCRARRAKLRGCVE